MMKSTFRWGLPLIILAFLLWGSLFLYYPIEIRPLAALQAFLPDGDDRFTPAASISRHDFRC